MDVTGVDQQPQRNHSLYNATFFVMYVLVGGLFVMNLFVGFIVDGFNANKGSSDAEVHYNRFMRILETKKPKYNYFTLPVNEASAQCRALVGNQYWQMISSFCVAINVAFNLSDHSGSPAWYDDIIQTQNNIFNYVLFVEVFLNLVGYGPGGFIDDKWKAFDGLVAVGSLAGMILSSPSVTKFSKAFRLVRILRLMIMIQAIRVIVETLISVLPQLMNILLLLVLFYSIFAVIFIQFFGLTKVSLQPHLHIKREFCVTQYWGVCESLGHVTQHLHCHVAVRKSLGEDCRVLLARMVAPDNISSSNGR